MANKLPVSCEETHHEPLCGANENDPFIHIDVMLELREKNANRRSVARYRENTPPSGIGSRILSDRHIQYLVTGHVIEELEREELGGLCSKMKSTTSLLLRFTLSC